MKNTVRSSQNRITETPNAVMKTLASPTLGGSHELSLWTVEMAPAARGPLHRFDREQVWNLVEGDVTFNIDGADQLLGEGDSIVVPAGAVRQITATSQAKLVVCGSAEAVVNVEGEEAARGVPAWIA